MTPEELADMLYKALLSANPAMVQAVARQAVDRYAGMEAGRPVGGTYYLYRTLRNLDLDKVMDRLVDQARQSASSHIEEGGQEPRRPTCRSPRSRSACCATSTSPGSTSCARRSRARSAAGWWPTGGARRWPSRSASRCPRTST